MYKPKLVVPEIEKISFGNNTPEKECWVVNVDGQEYVECEKFSARTWANDKSREQNDYNKGLANTPNDPMRIERRGALGEVSFAKIFNLSVNFDYCIGGVSTDFSLNGFDIDVKTSCIKTAHRYGCGMVRVVNKGGYRIPIKNDIYVFGCAVDDKEKRTAKVIFIGFCTKDYLSNRPDVPGKFKNSKHMNKEALFRDLSLMRDFRFHIFGFPERNNKKQVIFN